ncbi:ornithine--oxo-acid transaminase [Propioniciclava sp. MC1683]|uniref:ornithine--oxo-acid transaminase n=1 Tax=Propioniciclava sp. MC1683 TaxID=2760309 RepID=UPI0015FF139C|nr:ornithine--oxo-acid transaminase [Propioniciclava sp. MC1683]MBB1500206.1 ornithine--oxo-acid transaminase [Propioniciclava sp. MC1683]
MALEPRTERQKAAIEEVETYGAHNYSPLPVVISAAKGVHVTDLDGTTYIDCLSAYSAVNFGHGHPALLAAAEAQLARVTLTSRAFYSEPFGPFVKALAALCGKEMVLPMNTGVEAVETAIKAARKWGYESKGVAEGRAKIIVMEGNFHGRTTTVISFSNDPEARKSYAPYTPGFVQVPFGDADAIEDAIDDDTVAVLFEPIQGEAGVIVPPEGFLTKVREITRRRGVLMIADEIQAGLGRSGATFACDREGVVPDVYILGKALGGGIMPLSAVVADRDVLGLFQPGQHGSTFGGNPLACAIGSAVIELLGSGELQERSRVLGERFRAGLQPLLDAGWATEVRQAGLWLGVDVNPDLGTAKEICYRLMEREVLAKDTHGHTIRFAPPLVITEDQIDQVVAHTITAFEQAATQVR